jgi:cleavage and polyadenylation specificity factor subunit 2
MLRITPIYGSRWSSEGQAVEPECTLVEFSECRVLWNVGWCAAATEEPFPDLPDHDALILTDSTLQAAGGLPMYYKAMLLKYRSGDDAGTPSRMPPMYATYPTVKMGQMALYDQHAAISLDGGRAPYSLEDLDAAIRAVQSIKYSQSVTIRSLAVTAHAAGHVVGGAFYTLQRRQDETTIVLTSTYHIARELHLDSSTLLRHASTPDVLVTHPGGPAFRKAKALARPIPATTTTGMQPPQPALPPILVTQAQRNLEETVLSVLRRDGNVLLPVDASGRVIELLLVLQKCWENQRLTGTYNLCWLAPMVTNTADFARSQLEWMAAQLGREFDSPTANGRHPLRLPSVHLCSSMAELTAIMEQQQQNPTCVVASGLSLEAGPARDVLLKWADDPDNAIVFTDSSQCYLRPRRVAAVAAAAATTEETVAETMAAPSSAISLEAAPVGASVIEGAGVIGASSAVSTDGEDQDNEGEGGALVGSVVAEGELSEWTTAGQLMSAWVQAKLEDREMEDSIVIDVNIPHRAALKGAELKRFLENEEAARLQSQAEEEKRAMLREVEIAKGQLRLGEDEGGTTTASDPKATVTTSTSRPRKKSRFDSTLFLKFSKPLHRTYAHLDGLLLYGGELHCSSN